MSLLVVEVECEDNGTRMQLALTPEQYERAERESGYLSQLVAELRSSQSEQTKDQSEAGNSTDTLQAGSSLEQEDNGENTSSFIWTNSAVLLLLSLYEEHTEDFNVKRHKKVWEDIAKSMHIVNPALNVSGLQCQAKLNGLKRTYKNILDHNNKSGNDRASWPFFNRMHEIFSNKTWARPLSVASEHGPFPSTSSSSSEDKENIERPKKKKKFDNFMENYLVEIKEQQEKKRKEREERFNKIMELKEKHHQEKLTVLKHFLDKMT